MIQRRCFFYTGDKSLLFTLQSLLDRLFSSASLLHHAHARLHDCLPPLSSLADGVLRWCDACWCAIGGAVTGSKRASDTVQSLPFHPPRSALLAVEDEGTLLRHTGSRPHWCFETFALPPRESEKWTVRVEYEGGQEEMEVMVGVVEEVVNSGGGWRAA